jgi:hypothetical protein
MVFVNAPSFALSTAKSMRPYKVTEGAVCANAEEARVMPAAIANRDLRAINFMDQTF